MDYQDRAARWQRSVFLLIAFTSLSAPPLAAQGVEAPVLNAGTGEHVATAGYYTLSWTLPPDTGFDGTPHFELVEASDADFVDARSRYRGSDLATTISGKVDGSYFYRVRVVGQASGRAGPWSNVHQVVVAHHALSRAFAFLLLGVVVFGATSGMILYGQRYERRAASARVA